MSLRGVLRATKQSRPDGRPSARDCFAPLAMTKSEDGGSIRSKSDLKAGLREFSQPGEALGAVGGKVVYLPPLPDKVEQRADARAGWDAERHDVVAAQREDRRCPSAGEGEEFGQPVRADRAVGRLQQGDVPPALGAKAVERAALGGAIASRVEQPGRGEALQPVAPGIRKAQSFGQRRRPG